MMFSRPAFTVYDSVAAVGLNFELTDIELHMPTDTSSWLSITGAALNFIWLQAPHLAKNLVALIEHFHPWILLVLVFCRIV